MNDKIETRTTRDKTLAYILGICFGLFVSIIIFRIILGVSGYYPAELPPSGYLSAFGIGALASLLGFRLLDLAKSLLTSLGLLVAESGDLLEKTALEATVKIKEGKRKASEIVREADMRVGVRKEIKTEEDAYERAAEELEEETQNKGIWAKAFSDADGDEQKQKALYIKYRAEQLIKNIE